MTGLELIALAVGSTAGTSLAVRAWRRAPNDPVQSIAPVPDATAELVQRTEDDRMIEVFQRLVDEGDVDAATLGRARLFHDVATHADNSLERAAASGQLMEMLKEADAAGQASVFDNSRDQR